jgi:hypothetical protein
MLRGAIDFYVHASPDPTPRRADDIELARELQDAGLRAALHRHHHAQTADRAALASRHTGFPLLGAIELNGCVGGFNPAAVDVALAGGAVFVSFPTTSAIHMRTGDFWARDLEPRLGLRTDHGSLAAVDGTGQLHPAIPEILQMVSDAGAVLGLGYMSYPECLAVAEAGAAAGIDRIVLTNPTSVGGLSPDQARAVMTIPGTYLEVVVFTLHPENVGDQTNLDNVLALARGEAAPASTTDPTMAPRLGELVRRFGVERCVLSSDGGHAGDVSPPEELLWGCRRLAELGFSERELRVLVADTPARLLRL